MKTYFAGSALMLLLAAGMNGAAANDYAQSNLTSDLPGVAASQDKDLVNPWGLTALTGPFWTADNGSGLSTLYNGSGGKIPLTVALQGANDPTGIVGNATTAFKGDPFIYATESGTVNGWSPSGGSVAPVVANGASGSIYKGLAIGMSAAGNVLYAANFGLGRVDVYDSGFHSTTVSGSFKDPSLPAGYAPFNIQNLNGALYVTFAKTSGGGNQADGAHLGYVDVFDMNGNFVKRAASQGALNAPWGVAIAPAGFGAFSGDLIVGNFGDGTLNAYNPTTGTYMGALTGPDGKPISIPGLWGIDFGNGADGQQTDELYFNAGIPGNGQVEDHGLFGSLTAVPEPSSLLIAGLGLIGLGLIAGRRGLAR